MAGNEAENEPADVIANKQPMYVAVEATQATDKAAPDASGDKSTSVSNEVDTAQTQETTPTKAVPEPELGEDPAPRPPSTVASTPPPVPEKDSTAVNRPSPTSEETSASPAQTAEPAPTKVEDANKTEDPSAQPTEPETHATENADSSKLDPAEEDPKPQSDVDGDQRAVDEGSAMRDDDGKAEAATKLTLLTDRVRELSTASIMSASSSTPGTPAEDVASSAVDEEEGSRAGTSAKNKKKKKNKKKNKGEKNSPHPPSTETVRNTDDSTTQDRNPPVVATTAPVDIPIVEGEGELVEKEASGGEDSPVLVDKVDSSGGEDSTLVKVERPQGEAEKAAGASGESSTDEWLDWE